MTEQQMLLVILMEECDELSQRASKAIRFGMNEVQQGQELDNSARIIYEFNDLVATMSMLFKHSYIVHEMAEIKREKIKKWLEYSKEQGQLTQPK